MSPYHVTGPQWINDTLNSCQTPHISNSMVSTLNKNGRTTQQNHNTEKAFLISHVCHQDPKTSHLCHQGNQPALGPYDCHLWGQPISLEQTQPTSGKMAKANKYDELDTWQMENILSSALDLEDNRDLFWDMSYCHKITNFHYLTYLWCFIIQWSICKP